MSTSLKHSYFLKSAMLAALLLCFGAPAFAHADNINVVFQATPLFSDTNIAPGDTVTRSVTVTNTSGAVQDVYVKALNGVSTGSLGDKLLLTVTDGGATPISSLPLSTLVNGASQLLQSGLPDGSTATYDFSIYFDSSAGNEYQNSTLGFDLCVGFAGASGDTCISDTNGGGNNGGGNNGGGGGGSGGGGGTAFGPLSVGFQTSAGSGAAFISNNTPGGLVLGASTGPGAGSGVGIGSIKKGAATINTGTTGGSFAPLATALGAGTSNTGQAAAVAATGFDLSGAWLWWLLLLLLIILAYYLYRRYKDSRDTRGNM